MNDRFHFHINRRVFLGTTLGGIATWSYRSGDAGDDSSEEEPYFHTRGVVLTPEDFTWTQWPQAVKDAKLTTIGIHHPRSPSQIIRFIQSRAGQTVLEQCKQLGLQVEYELHAMSELLPRDWFAKDPTMFRVNEEGQRTPDANLCVHSAPALEIAAQNAIRLAQVLTPTTHRYYFWGDDGLPWCRCGLCRDLSDSEQALILENHLVEALRSLDAQAQLAHLAYANSLQPPRQIRPVSGLFLEFAPIHRRYDIPFESGEDPLQKQNLEALDANLKIFGVKNAQALEYWLDVSRFSKWTRPAQPLPFSLKSFQSDLHTYGRRGIRHITSFAVYIDEEYVSQFGKPPLREYGEILYRWKPGD